MLPAGAVSARVRDLRPDMEEATGPALLAMEALSPLPSIDAKLPVCQPASAEAETPSAAAAPGLATAGSSAAAIHAARRKLPAEAEEMVEPAEVARCRAGSPALPRESEPNMPGGRGSENAPRSLPTAQGADTEALSEPAALGSTFSAGLK